MTSFRYHSSELPLNQKTESKVLIMILVKDLNMIQKVLEFARNNKRLFMKLTK